MDNLKNFQAFAKTICSKQFYVYFVNDESKVIQTILLDYSQLLSNKDPKPQVYFKIFFFSQNLNSYKVCLLKPNNENH